MSNVAYAILASVPLQPTDVPISDTTITSATTLRVTYATPTAPNDGGNAIISYELQINDGSESQDGNDFVSLTGFTPNSMATHYTVDERIYKGRYHRFRYRAKNAVGWGLYSEEAVILAANVPSAPGLPTFGSFITATLLVELPPSTDNGGTAILEMEFWRDAGDDYTSAFTQVTSYDG